MKICDVTGMPDDDPFEQTQRLPVVNGVCNCPSENMIVHCVGCPLREVPFEAARPPGTYTFTIRGKPLEDLSLDAAQVIYPDGTMLPLIGIYFHRWDDKLSLLDNFKLAFGEQYPGCKLVFPL